MKKICFVTAARSEFGILKWLMKEVDQSEDFILQIVVTGGHLLFEQGYTVEQIKSDGFMIDYEVDAKLDYTTKESIAASMGRMAEGMAGAFAKLKPDYLVVLGDRYELLPICNTAFVMSIPIIHISGGDVTEGAIDDGIRNAVTMLAKYHFPGTMDSASNICRMRGTDKNIWVVGEPGLDAFRKETVLNRKELSQSLRIDEAKNWVLLTYHPETNSSLKKSIHGVNIVVEALLKTPGLQIVATYSNADYGGGEINCLLEKKANENAGKMVVIPSLGTKKYVSLMREVLFVIGNSSSGIIEAPSIGRTVINVGDRQKGRYLCSNVIQCSVEKESIEQAIARAMNNPPDISDIDYWGDGYTAERIMKVIKVELTGRKEDEHGRVN